MVNVIQFLSSQQSVSRLGWTLVYFLWQGALIASLYGIARRWLGHARGAQVRYLLACVALVALVAAPVITFSMSATSDSPAASTHIGASDIARATAGAGSVSLTSLPIPVTRDDVMPWLVMAWFAGALVFWIRLMGGWLVAARMRSMLVRPAPAAWQRRLDELRERICVSRPVRLLVSALVQVPTVVGSLRPVVLVPIGALSGLPAEHVEALLAHELAHIRRHDYLVNILQSVIEALLFYHPAVWWISNDIRNERELCCDDVAVAIGGDTFIYARALADLESYRPEHFTPALAASGGSLADRVARLLGQSRRQANVLPGPAIAVAAVLIVVAAYGLVGQTAPAHTKFDAVSIKPSGPFVPGNMRIRMAGGPGTDDPGRVIFEKYVLSDLLQIAYDVKFYQLSGPEWLMNPGAASPRFDITATIPEGTTKAEYRVMLQNLLAERFQVVAHQEKKELPVYNLGVAKAGSKLTPSTKATDCAAAPSAQTVTYTTGPDGFPTPPPCTGGTTFNKNGDARLQAVGISMAQLVNLLSLQGFLDRPVNDNTGLAGQYDFVLHWSRGGADPSDPYPTIFGAVQELGLKLEAGKAPVDVLVIDHIEKVPTDN